MKSRFLSGSALVSLLLALFVLLVGCSTPTEPQGSTQTTAPALGDILADYPEAVEALADEDRTVLIHLSDLHADAVRAQRAAQFAVGAGAEAVLVSGGLGDAETISGIFSQYSQVPAVFCSGEGDASLGFGVTELPGQQLRIISVDQSALDQTQVDWLIETLAATPEGFGVLLMYHGPEMSLTGAGDPAYPDFFQVEQSEGLGTLGTVLADIVDSFMMEKRFFNTYSTADGANTLTVDADFTGLAEDVEFLAHVTGHLHRDAVTYLPGTACRQLLLGVTAASEAENPEGDAFNAYIINRKKKTFRILRVGTGEMTVPYSTPFEAAEAPFSTEYLTRLELSGVQWVPFGMDAGGASEDTLPGLRFTGDQVFQVPYDGVCLWIKINAPFEVELRSGPAPDSLETLHPWLNNKAGESPYLCAIPAGHKYFAVSVANVTRAEGILDENPINSLELELAAPEIWYDPCSHQWETTVVPATCTQWGSSTAICALCGREDLQTVVTDISDRFHFTQSMSINTVNGKTFADDKWALSDFVDVSGYESLEVLMSNDNSTGTVSGLVFFNAQYKRVSGGVINSDGSGQYGVSVRQVEVPENAVYVRTIWFAQTNPGYDSQWGEFYCKATGPKSAIPPAGHSYEAVVTPPTCTKVGYTTHTCTACGDSYRDSELPMAHNYAAGVCTGCGVSVLGSEWLAPNFAEGDYTMLVLPDTQCLVENWPQHFQEMTQWIADNKDRLNIQAVLHLGAMVDDNLAVQWETVKEGMDRINAAGIPWMPMMGNHDNSEYFNRYFDYETYGTGQSWFGGSYEEGKLDHTYWFVTAGQREYLILSLGWAPTWEVLDWAKGIVEENPEKNVILTAHGYMNSNGQLLSEVSSISITKYFKDRPEGYQVWEAFQGYENLVLAMGGHVPSPDVIQWIGQNGAGRDVSSLLFDRQRDDIENHYGMIGILTFHAESDTVDINWYSADLDALYREKNQFPIEVPHK